MSDKVRVAIIGVVGSIFVAALSFAMGRWTEAAGRRREGYSAAKKTLVKYREYCWGIRRRTSDEAGELRTHRLSPGMSARVRPGRRHRFVAVEDTELFEVSSPEIDDVVRLEDAYGRAGTSAP